MHRRRLVGILTAALLLAPSAALALPGAGSGGADDSGDSDATALEVGGAATVSGVDEGGATGLEVLGQEVSGTSGDGGDHLVSTTVLGVPEDAVEASVLHSEVDGDSSSAAAVEITIGGGEGQGGATVEVLHAEREGDEAGTHAVSVRGAPGHIEVLESHAAPDAAGTTVLDLNGTEVLTEQDMGSSACGLELPAVIRAELLCAESDGEQGSAGIVRDLSIDELSDATGLSLDVLRANGAGAGRLVPENPDPTPDPDGDPDPGTDPDPTDDPARSGHPTGPGSDTPSGGSSDGTPGGAGSPLGAPAPSGPLANTGASILGLLAGSLGLLGAGAAMVGRRREDEPAN